MTNWKDETFGGVVVAMVAFICASLLLKIAVIPVIVFAVNTMLVIGIVSMLYGFYAAWRMGRIL